MTTTTRERKRVETQDQVTADSVIREMQDAQRRALAESELYRRTVRAAVEGNASDADIQAARIIGGRWNWSFDADLEARRDIERIREKFGDDCRATAEKLWRELERAAAELQAFREESQKRLHNLEVLRRDLELRQHAAHQSSKRVQDIQRERPHLFEALRQ